MGVARGVLLVLACGLAACSGSVSTAAQASDASAALSGTCTVPADAACKTARALLVCQAPSGAGEICVSDDPVQCPGPSAMPGVSFTCQNNCTEREYGAACGSIAGPSVEPPAGCRNAQYTPAGVAFYCCPCGP